MVCLNFSLYPTIPSVTDTVAGPDDYVGKNVQENRNIGRLNMSIVGMTPVKNIPIAPNASPPKKVIGMHASALGKLAKPRGMSTASITVTAAAILLAAHMISATMISSTLTGIARIPSNVF